MAKPGTCLLCGKTTDQLSKDHIQPQCAFNEKNRTYIRMESIHSMAIRKNKIATSPAVRNIYYEIQPDRPIAGGIYKYTQCEQCNSNLGIYYDKRFGVWCHEALELLKPGEIILVQREYTQRCRFPLSILKRVVAMFFSINGEKFAECHSALSVFASNPKSQGIPKKYKIYVAYNINDLVSHIPLQCRMNIFSGQKIWITQIAHPPFIYAITSVPTLLE